MKIRKDHMYHGAALIQITEDPNFTAINSMRMREYVAQNAYLINRDIGVYLKYATKPQKAFDVSEFQFNFNDSQLGELRQLSEQTPQFFLALVCVEAEQICCLSYNSLRELINRRKTQKGTAEKQYQILVTLRAGQSFRVNINFPGRKGKYIGEELIIPRNDFPSELFR